MNALLQQFLFLLLQLLGISQAMNQKVQRTATETTEFNIEHLVKATNDIANSGIYGSIALHNQLTALQTSVDGLSGGGGPVTLPTTPPPGYGADSSEIADQVWRWTNYGVNPRQTGQWLNWAGTAALRDWVVAVDRPYGDYWKPLSWPTDDPGSFSVNFPTFNPSDIGATEAMLDVILRQNPTALAVSQYYPRGQVFVQMPTTSQIDQWVTTFDETDFERMKAALLPTVALLHAPVWPGMMNVTLGASVALDRAVDLDEPMHGVIVTLTSVPPDKPRYTLGSETATAHIGQIAFSSGVGGMEYPQNLSFPVEIYCPTTMALALGVKLRTVPGVTGTVQAWMITP